MIDDLWLQELASASWQGKKWHVASPQTTAQRVGRTLRSTVQLLWDHAEAAVATFNDARAPDQARCRLLRIGNENHLRGLMLLMGTGEVRCEQHPKKALFRIYTSKLRGFSRENQSLGEMYPEVDSLGLITWHFGPITSDSLDFVIRYMMETVVRAHQATAATRSHAPRAKGCDSLIDPG